jgi:hypothetical protein
MHSSNSESGLDLAAFLGHLPAPGSTSCRVRHMKRLYDNSIASAVQPELYGCGRMEDQVQ